MGALIHKELAAVVMAMLLLSAVAQDDDFFSTRRARRARVRSSSSIRRSRSSTRTRVFASASASSNANCNNSTHGARNASSQVVSEDSLSTDAAVEERNASSQVVSEESLSTDAPAEAPKESSFVVREQSLSSDLPVEVPIEAPEIAELMEVECQDGEFALEIDGNFCQLCDPQCQADRCIDVMGCVNCNAGYYYVRPTEDAPFECRGCSIPHCVDCQDGTTDDGQLPRCIRCENGYQLSSDSKSCSPIVVLNPEPVERTPSSEQQETSSISTTQSREQTEQNYTRREGSNLCSGNMFMSGFTQSCVQCDVHALPNGCEDYIGCLGCMTGFFRRRSANYMPFACYPCTIANCALCKDDIPFHAPLVCAACDDGYTVDQRTGLCSEL